MKKLFVGNLPFSATENDIRELFESYGEIVSLHLVNDRETGRPRGFGFIEMDSEGAENAMAKLDGTEFGGRSLRVNEANQRPPRRQSW